MNNRVVRFCGTVLLGILSFGAFSSTATAQNARDLSGLWEGRSPNFSSSDISANLLPGVDVSLTTYGAERYRNVTNYAIEGATPADLQRQGVKRDVLQAGETVTVQGFMARDGSNNVNGREVFAGSQDGGPGAND